MAPIPESFFSQEITARTSGTTTTETSYSTDDPGPEPGTGRLIRILPNGKQKILIDSKRGVLVVPTGITFGPDGALYTSRTLVMAYRRSVPARFSRSSLQTGAWWEVSEAASVIPK
jgi:sugar lactone lactonase YvrE